MTKSLFLLREVADFAAGAFENTAVDEGGIQLGRRGTGHLPEGSYTSPPFLAGRFRRLIPSWNADTPPGTSIEVQVRVQAGGHWSEWFSFGTWCPYLDRHSPAPHGDERARVEAETLTLLPGAPAAESAQIRVHLRSDEEKCTPTVQLMALATQPEAPGEAAGFYAGDRVLEIPAYSALVRDPAIAERMGGATSLAMLMNRWGADVLPEEVARAIYDTGAGTYENLAFLSALGGVYGFECYVGYGGLELLRREVWLGHGIAAKVRYRAPALAPKEAQREGAAEGEEAVSAGGTPEKTGEGGPPPPLEKETDARPLLPGATVDSTGHLVVVRGFKAKDGERYVVLNDPMAPGDEAAVREVPLSLFAEMYTGIFLALHRGPKGSGGHKPRRKMVQIALENGVIRLYDEEETFIPGRFTKEDLPQSTLCYILSSPVAYASTAQRQFYYPSPDESGTLKFDESSAVNRRMTFYRIGPRGRTWVAEKKIEESAADVLLEERGEEA